MDISTDNYFPRVLAINRHKCRCWCKAMACKHQFPHNVDQQNQYSTRRKMTPANEREGGHEFHLTRSFETLFRAWLPLNPSHRQYVNRDSFTYNTRLKVLKLNAMEGLI